MDSLISTGFKKLDKVLGGGLKAELYCVGASQLLKGEMFVLQIAEQIASSGQEVIIFDYETAKARTKRLDGETIKHDFNTSTSKIVKGYRADKILAVVETHIEKTGNIPIVIIDYIQNLTHLYEYESSIFELKKMIHHFKTPVLTSLKTIEGHDAVPVTNDAIVDEFGEIRRYSSIVMGLQFKGVGKEDFDINEIQRHKKKNIELKILRSRYSCVGETIEYIYDAQNSLFVEK